MHAIDCRIGSSFEPEDCRIETQRSSRMGSSRLEDTSKQAHLVRHKKNSSQSSVRCDFRSDVKSFIYIRIFSDIHDRTNLTERIIPTRSNNADNVCKLKQRWHYTNLFIHQVTCEYKFQNGACIPQRVHTIVVSLQHSEKIDLEELRSEILAKVIKNVIPEKYLDAETIIHINPCGSFVSVYIFRRNVLTSTSWTSL